MGRLTEIGTKYNTDKATGHMFTDFYEEHVSKYINPKMIEVGIDRGYSLKMWEEYFGSPLIVGIDIDDKKEFETKNIKTIVANQENPAEVLKCLDICKEYQIIIDDGSHVIGHQISTMAHLFPYLASGGTYILEDLHTSFIGGKFNPRNDFITAYDFVYRVTRGWETETPYATYDQVQYIIENCAVGHIFQLNKDDFMHSITSVIVKK